MAGVSRTDIAVATGSKLADLLSFDVRLTYSVTYLFRTTGQVIGVSLSGALVQGVLLRELRQRITGPGADKGS
jgi:hypothetical protein